MSRSGQLVWIGLGTMLLGVGLTWALDAPSRPMTETAMVVAASTAGDPASCAGNESLSGPRLDQAMRDLLPATLPCMARAQPPESVLHLRVDVACSGRVNTVEHIEGADWPASTVTCLRDRLAGARFPSHGDVGGAIVDLPMRFPPLDAGGEGR